MDDEPGTSNETSNELHASEGNSKSTSYRGGKNCCVPHCGNKKEKSQKVAETICCHFTEYLKMEY